MSWSFSLRAKSKSEAITRCEGENCPTIVHNALTDLIMGLPEPAPNQEVSVATSGHFGFGAWNVAGDSNMQISVSLQQAAIAVPTPLPIDPTPALVAG